MKPKPGHKWTKPIGQLKKDCFDKIVAAGGGHNVPVKPGSVGTAPCKYTGSCYGKIVVVYVGFNPKPCISNAWMP